MEIITASKLKKFRTLFWVEHRRVSDLQEETDYAHQELMEWAQKNLVHYKDFYNYDPEFVELDRKKKTMKEWWLLLAHVMACIKSLINETHNKHFTEDRKKLHEKWIENGQLSFSEFMRLIGAVGPRDTPVDFADVCLDINIRASLIANP